MATAFLPSRVSISLPTSMSPANSTPRHRWRWDSTSYGVTSYELTSPGPNQFREDHFTYVNVRLSVPFLKRGTAGVFYQASKNTSTVSTYQISSTQVGFDLAYHF